jgi:peptide/nickel transport system substrate-binding protein
MDLAALTGPSRFIIFAYPPFPELPLRRLLPGLASACALFLASPGVGQQSDRAAPRDVVVIATPGDIATPIPTVNDYLTSYEVINLLYLRLAELGPTLTTVGDRGFRPMLARSWRRRDPVTLAFDLDPRATWHDGTPVTAADVVFSFQWAGQRSDVATVLRRIASVKAEGDRRVVFTFSHPYGEQFYDATWHVLIVPRHLLASIPRDSLPGSAFARNPVGNGPFRWSRHVPGQLIELAANERFFLGAPAIRRVVFRVATDAEARINMILTGEADVVPYLNPAAQARVRQDSSLELVPVVSPTLTYSLFNQRARDDRSKPHPILTDRNVRRALLLALDRETMIRAAYGGQATVPDGPVPQTLSWVKSPGKTTVRQDREQARRLLRAAGWTDTDGDGVLDRNGVPFELTIIVPNNTPQRPMLAQAMQAQFREVGVKLDIQLMDNGVFLERRNNGQFDMDMAAANLDPTPSGWIWSWSCEGAGQPQRGVGSYCNPRIDSLLEQAGAARDPVPSFRQILSIIQEDVPAVFLAAPSMVVAVQRRFSHRPFRAETPWLSLREWRVRPADRNARGRGGD